MSQMRWTSLIGAGLGLRVWNRARRLSDERWWAANAGRVQRGVLRGLLARAAGTEVGREFGFAGLAARDDASIAERFAGAMNIADYEAWRPRMTRMREGAEPDVSWPGVVMDWAQTSGTTGGQKYIPVSRDMMRANYRAALDIFAHAARFGVSLPSMLGGRLLFLGGSTKVEVGPKGVRTGDLSGLVTPLISWPLSEVYSPGPEVALMEHWPSKIDAMARLTLEQDVRFVSGMASWSLVLFEKVLELARQQGRRAAGLRDVWPGFTLFVHGGVKYTPFDQRVREVWSGTQQDIPFRLEVYPASEGFIAVQDRRGDPGLRLHTDMGVYYEFVPAEEIDSASPRVVGVDEVERGQRYVVVMSTCAGLWRYGLGDVVEFDPPPPDGPPRLRIVGRHRHFMNAFGENLIVEDIERAVVAARDASGLRIGEFTAAPVYPGPGVRSGLELAIEIEGVPANVEAARGHAGVQEFARALDATLRAHNVDYDTKRTGDLGMGPALVTPVAPGEFHKWMARRGKLGGQNKTPRLANNRELLDGLLSGVRNG